MTYDESISGTLTGNELQGAAADIATPDNADMLVKGDSGTGFYHWTETTIPANQGYLTLGEAVSVREFVGIDTGDGYNTAIASLKQADDDDSIYDLKGRRMTAQPRRGIYVRNGRKVVMK